VLNGKWFGQFIFCLLRLVPAPNYPIALIFIKIFADGAGKFIYRSAFSVPNAEAKGRPHPHHRNLQQSIIRGYPE